jgi:hypothetical protein
VLEPLRSWSGSCGTRLRCHRLHCGGPGPTLPRERVPVVVTGVRSGPEARTNSGEHCQGEHCQDPGGEQARCIIRYTGDVPLGASAEVLGGDIATRAVRLNRVGQRATSLLELIFAAGARPRRDHRAGPHRSEGRNGRFAAGS